MACGSWAERFSWPLDGRAGAEAEGGLLGGVAGLAAVGRGPGHRSGTRSARGPRSTSARWLRRGRRRGSGSRRVGGTAVGGCTTPATTATPVAAAARPRQRDRRAQRAVRADRARVADVPRAGEGHGSTGLRHSAVLGGIRGMRAQEIFGGRRLGCSRTALIGVRDLARGSSDWLTTLHDFRRAVQTERTRKWP